MMKMKLNSRISLLLVAFLLIGCTSGLTGCSGSPGSSKQVTITYWSIYPQGDPYTAKHQQYIDAFEKANPNIKIQHLGTNFWDYFSKLSTAQAGGQEVDVYWNDIVNVKFRAATGVAANLNPYLDSSKENPSQWTKADLDSCRYEDGIYALPMESDYRLLFYNKDHFRAAGLAPDSPPKTLDQLEQYAQKLTILTKGSNGKTAIKQLGFDPRLGNNQIQQIVWPMGGSFFDKSGNPTLNSATIVQGIQWWVKMCRKQDVRAFNQFQTEHSDGSGKDISFLQGATSMVIDENGLAWQIAQSAPKLNYGVAPVPYTGNKRYSWSGGFTLEMSAKAKGEKAQAAWKFIQYMTSKEVQVTMLDKLDFTPANVEAMTELQKTANANEKEIIDEFKYGRHVDYCAAAPQWWSYLSDPMSKAIAGKLTAQQAADQAQSSLTAAIKEYNQTH